MTTVEEVKKEKPKHIQAKVTPEEFKEINVWLAQNDITDKGDWFKMIILREVRGYESVQSNQRLHASKDRDGFDAFR